jgi:hypothetical protein
MGCEMKVKTIAVVVCGILVCACLVSFVVAANNSMEQGNAGLTSSVDPAAGSNSRIIGITYYIWNQKHAFDKNDPNIYVDTLDPVLIQAKGTYRGPTRGILYIRDVTYEGIPESIHTVLVPPGVVKTVSQSYKFSSPGTYLLRVGCYYGPLTGDTQDITVHVT